jgi:hypothetical protein
LRFQHDKPCCGKEKIRLPNWPNHNQAPMTLSFLGRNRGAPQLYVRLQQNSAISRFRLCGDNRSDNRTIPGSGKPEYAPASQNKPTFAGILMVHATPEGARIGAITRSERISHILSGL